MRNICSVTRMFLPSPSPPPQPIARSLVFGTRLENTHFVWFFFFCFHKIRSAFDCYRNTAAADDGPLAFDLITGSEVERYYTNRRADIT